MGTRADLYVQHVDRLEWLGSVSLDGYDIEEMTSDGALKSKRNASCMAVKVATTEDEFRSAVTDYFSYRNDVSLPSHGWPWAWEDSCTTDRAYVFDGSKTRLYSWGGEIIESEDDEKGPPPSCGWPDMTDVQNVAFGNRSGMIMVAEKS